MTYHGHDSQVQSSAYRGGGHFEKDSRERQRAFLVHENMEELAQRFAGTGRGGNLQWPLNLTRRIRRSIVRDKMHREWREGKRVVF